MNIRDHSGTYMWIKINRKPLSRHLSAYVCLFKTAGLSKANRALAEGPSNPVSNLKIPHLWFGRDHKIALFQGNQTSSKCMVGTWGILPEKSAHCLGPGVIFHDPCETTLGWRRSKALLWLLNCAKVIWTCWTFMSLCLSEESPTRRSNKSS